jgi:pyridoxamine 5'-phosphate oxidase
MKTQLHAPEDIRQQIWKELVRASRDKHHGWRTPVLATTGLGGQAQARTVVLRHAHTATGELDMYTDSRSAKVQELLAQAQAQLVFWSARLGWQLRAQVEVSVITSGPEWDALWEIVRQSPSAGDYIGALAPGARLPEVQGDADADVEAEHKAPWNGPMAAPCFAVLRAQLVQMDWLELSRTGHRRAQLAAHTWAWLAP